MGEGKASVTSVPNALHAPGLIPNKTLQARLIQGLAGVVHSDLQDTWIDYT